MMGRYTIRALEKGIRVENFLAGGDVLQWKSARVVAQAAQITQDEAFRILQTLVECGRAEKGSHGYRLNTTGIIGIAAYVWDYVAKLRDKYDKRSL